MAENEFTRQMVNPILDDLLEAAEKMRLEHLDRTAQARYKEVETFRREKEDLEEKLGTDHPRVKALERAGRSAEFIAKFADTTRNHAEYCSDDKYKSYNLYRENASTEHEEEDS